MRWPALGRSGNLLIVNRRGGYQVFRTRRSQSEHDKGQVISKPKNFLPELEGIRGYAFIVVFLVHYTMGLLTSPSGPGFLRHLWFYATQICWLPVPIFFVLSGFLITGILYDTRDRKGFFSVFYRRRALRILPLYYLALLVFAGLQLMHHVQLQVSQLSFLVYLQNIYTFPLSMWGGDRFSVGHLWSLAVEEQFYVLWPVVIWWIPERKQLLRFCYVTIAIICLLRFGWPHFHLPNLFAYYSTVTRCDALLMGAVLALYKRSPGFNMRVLLQPARWSTLIGIALFYARVVQHGDGLPLSRFGIAVLLPLVNLIAVGIVVLCLIPGTYVHRLCRVSWVCSLGSLSYGLYVFHDIPAPFIQNEIAPWLSTHIGRTPGRIVVLLGMAAITYLTARLSYRFLESPAMRVKDRIRYGKQVVRVPRRNPLTILTPTRRQPSRLYLNGDMEPSASSNTGGTGREREPASVFPSSAA